MSRSEVRRLVLIEKGGIRNMCIAASLARYSSLVLLVLFCSLYQTACSQSSPGGQQPSLQASATAYNATVDLDLSAFPTIDRGASLTISNQGSDTLVLPAVVAKGSSALNRPSILSFVQSAGPLTDEQFAMSTWNFVIQNTFHYCSAGAPGDPKHFALDPMRVLHGYGFACCDQSSRILIWLWQQAGYQTRIAEMPFHTVPEIRYNNAWHMYDGDHRVYYLAKDDQTVASVAEIIADPSLVARVSDANGNDPDGFSAQWMADQYAAARPSYFNVDYSTTGTYGLHPGQNFTMRYLYDPPIFYGDGTSSFGSLSVGSGQFDWSLDFSQASWAKLPVSYDGVTTLSRGTDAFLTNTSSATGEVTYSLSSAFPVLTLQLGGLVYRANSNAAVSAYVSTDGSHWSAAFPLVAEAGSEVQTTSDLTTAARGQYSYFVKIKLAGEARSAAIAEVHIIAEVQQSYFLFPKLIPGKVNHLIYQDWSPATAARDVKVSFSAQ